MSPSSAHPSCPQCHAPLPEDAPQGLCPDCLMAVASLQTDQDTLPLTRADFPTLDEIASAFPDLEIVEKIGQGGMGIVFKARQPKLDRTVALKVLPKTLAATPGFPERFKREGRVLARLNHPSIVTVYDFGESGGFCYLLMEHVDGVNLRQAMRAGRFTPDQALKVVPDICTALQYAHEQGVLHRDIKPENILLDSKGRVKIADFGIAKLIDETGQEMLLTQSGAKLGTAPYMAPEQIEQPSTVDHRADIYSLGVVLYELLTGELPLGRFAAPSEKSAVNGSVDEVVFRALEKERGRRQQSAGEFKTQIESLASMPHSMQRVIAQRFQSHKSSASCPPPSTLVFWTIPAFLLLCTVLWWMLYQWATAGADMALFIIPTVISSMGILLYAVSLPLWLRLVPMNSWYGVRLPSTFLSDERWYEVNAHFGKHLFWWSLAVIGAGIAGFYQLPRHQDSYPWAAVTLSLVAVAASVISTLWWMHQNPVDAPKPQRSRLAKWSGQIVVAIVIVLFIRTFIVHAYSIPNGGEPGVAKGSYWLASRLNTGFAAGELIAFQHESGHTWLARVVAKEDKGLRLKRGGSPDAFFMPWDKIVGKMWFSYLSPDALPKP